jgi:hypothetical protein
MEATKLQNDIQELNDAIEVEKLVSKKIQDFIKKKKEAMDKTSESRDKLREKKLQELGVAKEKISTQQE